MGGLKLTRYFRLTSAFTEVVLPLPPECWHSFILIKHFLCFDRRLQEFLNIYCSSRVEENTGSSFFFNKNDLLVEEKNPVSHKNSHPNSL